MSLVVRVACDPALLRYIVEQGSIAVDAESTADGFPALRDDRFQCP